MSAFFIKHPAIAAVIAIVTTLLGLVCMFNLPISQYPEITPRTIQLQAMFPGANAQAVADSVGTPLERQISGVQGMDYMTSVSSNNGVYNLSVIFEPGSDTDIDQVLTNMRYGQASSQLPQEVQSTGVTIKQQPGLPLMIYSLTSPDGSYHSVDLANYAQVKLVDELKRVEGVGEVQVYGAGRYAIRIWLDTSKMTHYGVSVNEVRGAISAQNTTNPGGKIGADPVPDGQEQTITVRTQGRLSEPHEFEDIIIRQNGDEILYLKDIAKVELGAEDYSATGRLNGEVSAAVVIFQSPGSNAIATADRVEKLLEAKAPLMPEGITGRVSLDTTTAVRYSIDEIKHTFMEAVILVALVVYVFLQNWRATLIPLIAVPVSLISTFCLFPVLGFSLNTISLLGMVLAIGLVVDDAIVVVEAVQEHIDKELNPRMASFASMQEVSGPVIAIALVLAAVFLPSLLLEGITGTLFKQFAVTIAISMLISAFNALTLSPALCALLLKPRNAGRKSLFSPFHRLFNRCYGRVSNGYTRMCGSLARKLAISIPLLLLFWGAVAPVAERVPGGFLPDEDQGFLLACLILKPNTSLQVAYEQDKKFEAALQDPAVKNLTTVVGLNILNSVQTPGACIAYIELKDWSERPETSAELAGKLQVKLAQAGLDGMAMVLEPPAIPGVGTANGVTMVLEDLEGQGVAYLHEQVQRFQEAASRRPEIALCMDMMMADMPQKYVNLDKEKCKFHKVDIDVANGILASYNGSSFINYFNAFGQQWQVYIQAQGEDRASLEKMDGFFVTNADGARVPLSALVNIREIEDTEFVMHHNIYNAAKLNVMPRPGHSTQQVMDALEEVFRQTMDPTKVGFDYQDMSFQENKVRNSIGLGAIFTMSAVFAFLILVALYEKWSLPLAVFLTVPIAVLGAYAGLFWQGMELTLYAQIGLVMLVGLAAKNAILIVEFANLEMQRGKGLMEAALAAARLRLRPILMTSLAFVLGCIPLMLSSGSGALARNAIGTVVVIGMGVATLVGAFLIPCSYVFIMRLFRIKFSLNDLKEDPDEVGARKYLAAHTKD
ncbi:efflux RND transporter permease subunit [Akkermansia sp.]|uniref:efflux RND transporter permease subunit n=1 Tax=Akkermansia sp. TaxID=1872421 RepID=UPI0025BB0171|nr:efflux RND transporter permease subunit [Akkermansia sp.]MCD8273124.1 efflux RND transporter permease subunit [Akkermansia sp.]